MPLLHVRRWRALLVFAVASAAALAPAVALADPTFSVMNASGGIYWRSGPDWNTAEAVAGNGFYPDTTIAVHCYQSGAGNVPGSADTMWEQASVVGGSGTGSGWINEHFINDGSAINQPSPGVPPCSAPPPPPPPATPPAQPSITASLGGQYGCANCSALNIAVHNFPVGTYTYYCHDNSGSGGSDTIFYSHAVAVTDPNQSTWPGVFCDDNSPYAAYLVMDGVTSNVVSFAGTGPGSPPVPGGNGPPSSNPPPPVSPPGPASVFYSPLTPTGGVSNLTVSDHDLSKSAWGVDRSCAVSAGLAISQSSVPSTVSTLSGWSYGRVGPMYFLVGAGAARVSHIHYVVLFDPGATRNIVGSCDTTYIPQHFHTTVSAVLAAWLNHDTSNHLLILTGQNSEDRFRGSRYLSSTFGGLKTYYLADIAKSSRSVVSRTLICDYNNLGHSQVLQDFYGVVRFRPSGCPVSPLAPGPRVINP